MWMTGRGYWHLTARCSNWGGRMEEGAGISETGSLGKASWCEWKGTADIARALVLKASAGAGCCHLCSDGGWECWGMAAMVQCDIFAWRCWCYSTISTGRLSVFTEQLWHADREWKLLPCCLFSEIELPFTCVLNQLYISEDSWQLVLPCWSMVTLQTVANCGASGVGILVWSGCCLLRQWSLKTVVAKGCPCVALPSFSCQERWTRRCGGVISWAVILRNTDNGWDGVGTKSLLYWVDVGISGTEAKLLAFNPGYASIAWHKLCR